MVVLNLISADPDSNPDPDPEPRKLSSSSRVGLSDVTVASSVGRLDGRWRACRIDDGEWLVTQSV
jgi:hypothetical protein